MRLLPLIVLFACTGQPAVEATPPTPPVPVPVPPVPAEAPCALDGACSSEGTMCTPTPIGTGWAHALVCSSGKWMELEIAPMPQNPQPD